MLYKIINNKHPILNNNNKKGQKTYNTIIVLYHKIIKNPQKNKNYVIF